MKEKYFEAVESKKETDERLELEKEIKSFLKEINDSNTKLDFDKFERMVEDEDECSDSQMYYILSLYGGLNGRGQFLFYLEDVAKLVKKLMIRFDRIWLIEWKNDCPDDVFSLKLGMRINY